MGSSSGSTTTTQKADPWSGQQPYLIDIFEKSRDHFYDGGREYYPGLTVAPFSPDTDKAFEMQRSLALHNPISSSARDLTSATLRGDFLGQNPYRDEAYDSAARAVTRNFKEGVRPSLDASFAKYGRSGSGLHGNTVDMARDSLGRSLNDLADKFYFDTYRTERQNQLQALGLAPSANKMGFADAAAMRELGLQQEQWDQRMLDEMRGRYEYDRDVDYDMLKKYSQLLYGNFGQTVTTEQPYYKNRTAGALGGAAAGSTFGPWGAAIGGLVGLLS